jgi:FAD-dependent urate hydroxylase
MNRTSVAVIGAGPYGLSIAAHLAATKVEHRIFGRPMEFWSQIAEAGGERYLKSYCFGTNISSPKIGFSFADYNRPRGLETFEPCAIADFAGYGHWFQEKNVPWVEPIDVAMVNRDHDGFAIKLVNGERLTASKVVIATGLKYFDRVPPVLASISTALAIHTSVVRRFSDYKGLEVAVIGAGQSALEAAALLNEAGARPMLLVREDAIRWHNRVSKERGLWARLRSPISGLGSGPKAWALTHFPGAVHRMPSTWRKRFVRNHLPPEGAWWLRERVENRVPIHFGTTVIEARESAGRVALRLRIADDGSERQCVVDRIVCGTGYLIDVERLSFLDPVLRRAIDVVERAPKLSSSFETSVPGLHFMGPACAASFGPLFRFVVGAEYTARVVSAHFSPLAHSKS